MDTLIRTVILSWILVCSAQCSALCPEISPASSSFAMKSSSEVGALMPRLHHLHNSILHCPILAPRRLWTCSCAFCSPCQTWKCGPILSTINYKESLTTCTMLHHWSSPSILHFFAFPNSALSTPPVGKHPINHKSACFICTKQPFDHHLSKLLNNHYQNPRLIYNTTPTLRLMEWNAAFGEIFRSAIYPFSLYVQCFFDFLMISYYNNIWKWVSYDLYVVLLFTTCVLFTKIGFFI